MKLKRLFISNFRNYEMEEIYWHRDINIIRGFNAQGKSNLLEAIAYLSLAASFRGATDKELIRFEEDFFHIQGNVIYDSKVKEESALSVGYTLEKRKSWKINSQSQNRLANILGNFHTVIFSPDDLYLVKSGPLARRKYLNRQMIQLYPDFYTVLLRYNQILKQRNNLLKSSNHNLKAELEPWNKQLSAYASLIYQRRLEILNELTQISGKLHHKLCSEEYLTLEYKSFLSQDKLKALTSEEIALAFEEELVKNYPADRGRGITTIGPHRDDLEIFINEVSARRFGSQGQQKSAALSLKLAELELAFLIKGEYPVLLLDDVMSELDENRRSQLLTLMASKAQLFITATDLNFNLKSGKIILVDNGKIVEQN